MHWALALVPLLFSGPPEAVGPEAAACSLAWPGSGSATTVEPLKDARVLITFDGTDCDPVQGCVPGQDVVFEVAGPPYSKAGFPTSRVPLAPDGARLVARAQLTYSVDLRVGAETVYQLRLEARCEGAAASLVRNMVVAVHPAAIAVINSTFAQRDGQHWVLDVYNRGNVNLELHWNTDGRNSRSNASWQKPLDRVLAYSNTSSQPQQYELVLLAPHGNGTFAVYFSATVQHHPDTGGPTQVLLLEVSTFSGRSTPHVALSWSLLVVGAVLSRKRAAQGLG